MRKAEFALLAPKKGVGGVSKIYLVDPNDLVFSDDRKTVVRFKRQYGRFKRTTILLTEQKNQTHEIL